MCGRRPELLSYSAGELGSAGDKGDEAVLVLPVTTRTGKAEVLCKGEILSVELVNQELLSTLKIWIDSCDEGAHKGVFYDYVRWLHFNALRTT